VTLTLFGFLTSACTLLCGSLSSPPPKTLTTPPPSTPGTWKLHLEVSLLLMMFLFGHVVEIRRCRFQRYTYDSYLPKDRFVLVGRSHSFPLVGCFPSRPSPIPCNVTGVSQGSIPITVTSTCLHGGTQSDYFLWAGCSHSVFDTTGESLTKVLVRSQWWLEDGLVTGYFLFFLFFG
jgi:hypothetical protein